MGYTRTWIPPTIPYRDNLAVWKTISLEIHGELIASGGWIQSPDTGQLDINAVAALPADGSYAGYRIYFLADALHTSAPIYMKLEFGCANEGHYVGATCRSRTLRIQVSFGKATDGAGNITALSIPVRYGCPQTFSVSGTVTTELTNAGMSYICSNPERGFFGFVYGAGSRNKPLASANGGAFQASFALFLQRTTNSAGVPTSEGFTVYGHSINTSLIGGTNVAASLEIPSVYFHVRTASNEVFTGVNGATRHFAAEAVPIGGVAQFHPVFTRTPQIKQIPTLLTYRTIDLAEGTQVQAEVIPGQIDNFITLGNEIEMVPDSLTGSAGSFAMLYQ